MSSFVRTWEGSAGSSGAHTAVTVTIADSSVGNPDFIVLFVGCGTGVTITITDTSGLTWRPRTKKSDGAHDIQSFYVANVASGSFGINHAFTATTSGTAYPALKVLGYSGGKITADPFDQEAQTSGTSPLAPGTVFPGEINELVLMAVGGTITTAVSTTVGSMTAGQIVFDGVDHYSIAVAEQIQTSISPANTSLSWTAGGTAAATAETFRSSLAAPSNTHTFFGTASSVADNGSAAGPTASITPPASMLAGDLVVVFGQKRDRAVAGTQDAWVLDNRGGQTWNMSGGGWNLNGASPENVVRHWWCEFNGTWSADPSWQAGGTDANTFVMLVIRPTTVTGKMWVPDVWPSGANFNNFTAGSVPVTRTITAINTRYTNGVAFAVWLTGQTNTWDTLAGTGWTQSGLSAQYRNTAGATQSLAIAYNFLPDWGPTFDVSMSEATGAAGNGGLTYCLSFSQVDKPVGTGSATFVGNVRKGQTYSSVTPIAVTMPASVTSGNNIVGSLYMETSGTAPKSIRDDKGNDYKVIAEICSVDFTYYAMIFVGFNITNSPTIITATLTANSPPECMWAMEFSGRAAIDTTSARWNAAPGAGGTASPGALTLSATGLVVSGLSSISASPAAPQYDFSSWSPTAEIYDLSSGTNATFGVAYKEGVGAGNITPSCVITTDDTKLFLAVAFIAGPGGNTIFVQSKLDGIGSGGRFVGHRVN